MKWKGLGHEDITDAFTRLGHIVSEYPFSDKELHKYEKIEKDIKDAAQRNNADIIFSFNYFHYISQKFCSCYVIFILEKFINIISIKYFFIITC